MIKRNLEEEKEALEILRFYFKDKIDNFSVIDKPDLQNEIDSIGIEVTCSLNSKLGQTRSFFEDCAKNGLLYEEVLLRDKHNQQIIGKGENENQFSITCIIPPDDIFPSIERKLKKLNKGYKIFKQMYLYVLSEYGTVDKDYIEKTILTKITELEKGNIYKFHKYFIHDWSKKIIYVIDTIKKNVLSHKL